MIKMLKMQVSYIIKITRQIIIQFTVYSKAYLLKKKLLHLLKPNRGPAGKEHQLKIKITIQKISRIDWKP